MNGTPHTTATQANPLRDYQRDCVDALRNAVRAGRRAPIAMLPTGAGKAHVAAQIAMNAARKGSRVLVATHRRELLVQNRSKLVAADPALEWESCFYSAGLKEKSLDRPIVFGGVQSLCRAPAGPGMRFDVVLVDECHRVPPPNGQAGQYQQLLDTLRASRPDDTLPILVGLSATPYRHDGYGYLHEAPKSVWSSLDYEADMLSLVEQGYLAPLTTVTPEDAQIDLRDLKIQGREFTGASHETAMSDVVLRGIAGGAARQFKAQGRRGLMAFTPTVGLTERLASWLREYGLETTTVLGDDPTPERDRALEAYRNKAVHAIVSCGVLTEGFDAPHTDMIVMARATQSPGLWVQVAGRGSRPAPGKRDCLIRDHGSNAARHGPVNAVAPARWQHRKAPPRKPNPDANPFSPGLDTEKAALDKLDLAPSVRRMMVGRGTGTLDSDWQRVTAAFCSRATSRAGNDMAVLRFDLEGKPSSVVTHLVLSAKPRSRCGSEFRWITGYPLTGDGKRDYEVAERAAREMRRVALVMDGRWPRIAQRDRAARLTR